MYPDRTNQGNFFDTLINTLSKLVSAVCREWAASRSQAKERSADFQTWTIINETRPSLPAPSLGSSLTQLTKIPCFVIAPHKENSHFVGRGDILDEIHAALAPDDSPSSKQRTFALTGLGGMGKTQIALKYAFKYRNIYPVTLWAHADNEAKLAESFCVFAAELGLGKGLTSAEAKEAVGGCLTNLSWFHPGGRLLIV